MKALNVLARVVTMSLLMSGCNEEDSKKVPTIRTDFAVTGSGQDAVALSPLQKGLNLLVPQAIALTPPHLEDANGATVSLNEAWIVFKKIQFHTGAEGANESEESYHYKGPFHIDLLTSNPEPFGKIDIPESPLRRVKMLLHKSSALPAGAPSALNGNSIYLSGSVNSHSFSFVDDDTTDFEIKGSNAVVPEEGKDLLMVIRMADLFKKIDLSSITSATVISSGARFPATNPCPDIHPTSADLYSCFRKGLNLMAKFGKDNGDKDLDGDDEVVSD